MESIFFPFRADPFQKVIGVQGSKWEVSKVVSLLKIVENLQSVSSLSPIKMSQYSG